MKEDYCSYEVAKLLKEKGFDGGCDMYYTETGSVTYTQLRFNQNEIKNRYSRPTHQIVMKWLREVYNYIITIDYDSYENENDNGVTIGYSFSLQKKEKPTEYEYIHNWVYDTYEEAVDAALKYCLTILI